MPKKIFYPLLFLLLAFPAIVHAFVLYSHGTLDWGHVDKNFLYNYLWMALPHFITVVLMLFKFASKPFTLINLIVLNIAMRGGLTKLNNPISDKVYSTSQ